MKEKYKGGDAYSDCYIFHQSLLAVDLSNKSEQRNSLWLQHNQHFIYI